MFCLVYFWCTPLVRNKVSVRSVLVPTTQAFIPIPFVHSVDLYLYIGREVAQGAYLDGRMITLGEGHWTPSVPLLIPYTGKKRRIHAMVYTCGLELNA